MKVTRPPTRVSSACDRCRRQKQRCDDFRPCANCVHARVECSSTNVATPSNKRPRLSKRQELQEGSIHGTGSFDAMNPFSVTNDSDQNPDLSFKPIRAATEHRSNSHSFQRESAAREWYGPRNEQLKLSNLRGSDSAVDMTKKILGLADSPTASARDTFAIPGGASYRAVDLIPTDGRLMSVAELLGIDLPAREISNALIDTYFCTVHWFSLVVYEPKFRVRYETIMDCGLASESDRGFLCLLLMMIVMGCWYGSEFLSTDIISTFDLAQTRKTFLKILSQSFMDLIDDDSLEFVQLSTLLGSYWLYWGRPRSAFSILGAATKTAQSMQLHRDSDNRLSYEDAEERKRVWWTIYTWDRFAAIIYGRPLGINDKDCNVSMPASFSEDVSFLPSDNPTRVSLSPYQIQLNRIYQIASPLLENIYGIRYSHDRSLRSQMPVMVAKIDYLMQAWQDDLPPHLHLDKNDDINTTTTSIEEKMHRLQALSLQLTYDNLMIVIHRPLLADQRYWKFGPQNTDLNSDSRPSQGADSANIDSFRRCLDSALRISRVHQNKSNLVALARRTHLVSFLGINLFTSSVVMFISAVSDILSDTAQEAKRGLSRNLKVLKLLSGDGSLSMQCSVILEDLVQQIVNKEKEEMLCALPTNDEIVAFLPSRKTSYIDGLHRQNLNETNIGPHEQASDESKETYEGGVGNVAEVSGSGGFAIHRAMASLQEVLKDVGVSQFPISISTSSQQHPIYNQTRLTGLDNEKGDFVSFAPDGLSFNTDDVGQFWLWSMEPCMDDTDASQHLSDDYNQ